MSKQQLVTFCKLMTPAAFETWYAGLDTQQRAQYFPSFDDYLDCVPVA
jgi:hypothetical protein